MKKTFLLFSIVSVCSVLMRSQALQTHIPAYAQYVITLNAQSYTGKVDMKTISKMDFFNPSKTGDTSANSPYRVINAVFCQPVEHGIQMLPQAYMFRIDHDSVMGWCCLFGVKDESEFGKFLTSVLHEKGKPNPVVTSAGGYNKIQSGLVQATWTKDFALLLIRDKMIPYGYTQETEANQAYDQARQDSIQAVQLMLAQLAADSIKASELKKEEELRQSKAAKTALNKKKTPAQLKAEQEAEEKASEEAERQSAIADSIAYSAKSTAEYTGNSDWEKKEREREERGQKQMQLRADRRLRELMNLDESKSVAKVRSFTESQKEKFDVALWMNYSNQIIETLNPMLRNRSRGDEADTSKAILRLLKDNYSVTYCTFEQGKLHVTNKAYTNPEMDKLVTEIYKKKGNKDFSKYIRGENLLGYASMSMNVEPLLKATHEVMVKTYEATMGKESKYITGAMDITALFTNEDVVNNLFKGDIAVAITDLRPFKTTSLSYTYDENFKRNETKQEKTEVLPEFVAMATVGKPVEMDKILKAVEKMGGLHSEGPGVYLIETPEQTGFKIYIALENNILFCTNNEDLVHGKLKTGYPKNERMTAAQQDLMKTWPIAYYWDGKKTLDLIGKQTELKSAEKILDKLNLFKGNMSDASLTGVRREGNAYVTSLDLNFSDSSENSLLSICKLLNGFYKLESLTTH